MFERVAKEVDTHLQDAEAWNRVTDQSDPLVVKQRKCFESQHHPLLVGLGLREADQGVIRPLEVLNWQNLETRETGKRVYLAELAQQVMHRIPQNKMANLMSAMTSTARPQPRLPQQWTSAQAQNS